MASEMVDIELKIDDALLLELRRMAGNLGITVDELVNRLLNDHMEKYTK